MRNINSFLKKSEEEKLQIEQASRKFRIVMLLFSVVVIFFIMYPAMSGGRQGTLLWVALVVYILISYLSLRNRYFYILTNKRLLGFQEAHGRPHLVWEIHLSTIRKVSGRYKHGHIMIFLKEGGIKKMAFVKDHRKVISKMKEQMTLPS